MALLFNYSANNIQTAQLPGAFAGVSGTPTVGLGDGPQGINTVHTDGRATFVLLPNVAVPSGGYGFFVGAGFNVAGGWGAGVVVLFSVGTGLCVQLTQDGSMQLAGAWGGAPIFASASGTFTFNVRHEVELLASTYANTNSCTVYLDGVAVPALTGKNIANWVANAPDGSTLHTVEVGGGPGAGSGSATAIVVDSTYCGDTTGSFFTAPVGPAISIPMFPAGDGAKSQWTPNGAASGWQCISEVPPDGDTTYISDATPGDEEACTLTSPFGISAVYGISVIADQRQDTSGGGRSTQLGLGNGSTQVYGTAWGLSTAYAMNTTAFSDNTFSTPRAWTLADLSTLQVAVKLAT